MKPAKWKFAGPAAAALVLCAMGFAAQKPQSFSGEIMDDACADMGSHAAMAGKGENNKSCTLSCVKSGSKFVLYSGASKKTYQLDDQKKPMPFAGNQVTVTGTLDPATSTIHVATIAAAK